MTNLSKFAAQQLSKKQMNNVKGGAAALTLNCIIIDKETGKTIEWSHSVMGQNTEEVLANLTEYIGEDKRAEDCRSSVIFY